jgi:three-Cys-motif partner protein
LESGIFALDDNGQIEEGDFEEKVGGVLDDLRKQGQRLAPTFAFIDPFGATGLPFRVIADILSYRSCEVLLNLDSDGISRLISAQEFEKNQKNLDALFGDQHVVEVGR